ncbi:hypothetical protein Tco_0857815 [Tanacetum coccineum]|uniref:Uncharacterized protein n=1 Tax=Tanacetum coccineum TaxID=301880 RepID=A0ABQ5BBA2_9ASTR
MNGHLKAHRDFQQVMDDSMSKLRETFQTWLQQRQEQVVNLILILPSLRNVGRFPFAMMIQQRTTILLRKNDRFDTESYLLESLLNRDTLMASSPKIDSLFDEFAGELITICPRIVNREHESDDYRRRKGDDNSTVSLPDVPNIYVATRIGDSTIDVVEDIPVDVPNILPTHPALHMDFDFIPSHMIIEPI